MPLDISNQCKSCLGGYRCIRKIGHKNQHKDFYGKTWEGEQVQITLTILSHYCEHIDGEAPAQPDAKPEKDGDADG